MQTRIPSQSMEDPIAGDGEGIPSQAGDAEGIPSPAMGSAGPPAAAASEEKTCMASCSDSASSCMEATKNTLVDLRSATGFGNVVYSRVYFADQDGADGKPTGFLPDQHRKYDAKVRVPTAQRNAGGCSAR